METKHTPGPWEAILDEKQPRRRGGVVAGRMALVRAGGDMCIDCTHSGNNYEEDAANARLIAAAPDLLAALESLLNALPSATTHPAIQQARAALARAKE